MLALAQRLSKRQFVRFLIAGGVNTIVTYAVFVILSSFLHYSLAYTATYAFGMVLSYGLAGAFVFGTGFRPRSALRFPFIYVVQYLYGLGLLFLLIDIFGVDRYAAALVVIVTGIPLNFMLQRYAMSGGTSQPRDNACDLMAANDER